MVPLLWGTFGGRACQWSIVSDIKRRFCNQWQPHISNFWGPVSIFYLWQPPPQGFLQKLGVEKVEQNDHHNNTGWLRKFLVTGTGRSPGCCDYVWIFQMHIRFLTVTWICSSCLLNNINTMLKLFHIPTMLNLTSSHSHLATLHLIVCQLGFAHLFCLPLCTWLLCINNMGQWIK